MTDDDLSFYVGMLRFVAAKADPADFEVAPLMAELTDIAGQLAACPSFTVPLARIKPAARAFAGLGAFLQRQILPAAVAESNDSAIRQIRWAVDTSLETVSLLLRQLELGDKAADSVTVDLNSVR